MAGEGLMWLGESSTSSNWPFCFTFVRGTTERRVFTAFGADPDQAVPRRWNEAELARGRGWVSSLVQVGRSAEWLFARQDDVAPAAFGPQVWRRLSVAGAEAVALYHDIGKLNHQLAHAFDGEVVSAVTTCVPPYWYGSDPDRLRPLAEELCLPDHLNEPLGWPVLLAIAEGVFGLSLAPEDLNRPWPTVPIPQ